MTTPETAMKQEKSWFSRYGTKEHPNLVGQIYFPTNRADVDRQDQQVLDRMIDYYSVRLAPKPGLVSYPIRLDFVGNADHRGNAAYNKRLSQRRTDSVREYLTRSLGGYRAYQSTTEALGERYADRKDLSGSRRVDIYASLTETRPPIHLGETHISGDPGKNLSNRFGFATVSGASLGLGAVAGQVITIRIRDLRNNRVAYYTYTGAGAGIGFSVNRSTDETIKVLPDFIRLEDFEGNGRIVSVAAGIDTGTAMEFLGPKERGAMSGPLRLTFDGWDFAVGAEFDRFGYWHERTIGKE